MYNSQEMLLLSQFLSDFNFVSFVCKSLAPHTVFAESARPLRSCILFLLSLGNPSDYFQIFALGILALGNLPGYFFFAFFSLFNKIRDGRQNPISLSRA